MAATAISLQLRPNRRRFFQNPSFSHFSSSSSSPSDPPNPEDQSSSPSQSQSQSQSQSSFSSYFSDVKASLKQSPSPQQRLRNPRNQFSFNSNTAEATSKVASLEEIRKNLSEFRRRSTVPPSNSPAPQPTISFQELFRRNVIAKGGDSSPSNDAARTGQMSFDAFRESLRKTGQPSVQNQAEGSDGRLLQDRFKQFLKLRPASGEGSGVIGRWENFPESFKKGKSPVGNSAAMKAAFVNSYNYVELGGELRKLRPEVKGKNWFSLAELNERLMKFREIEKKRSEELVGGIYKDLKDSLITLEMAQAEKTKKNAIHRLDILGQLGGTPSFMMSPPKENLVEKYFHPDNMSSSQKLKLELNKVRDEFKMSESDCGSAPVQVAQLTTKIKHLSSVLHKKDKHSRKGLQAMVQQRKKLLKYLRRTDWESYCLVLSKLGLRDNPDYKA